MKYEWKFGSVQILMARQCIIGAVHALVMDEEIVSLHYSIYSGSHLKTILKLGRKTNYQTYGKRK